MRNLVTYEKFVNESLVILSMDKLMKNEFMNNIVLKRDFESARNQFYQNGGSLFSHIDKNEFELRTYTFFERKDLEDLIESRINTSTERMKFRIGKAEKKSVLKEQVWIIKCKLD